MNILDLLEFNDMMNLLEGGVNFDQQFVDHFINTRFQIDKATIYIPTYYTEKFRRGEVGIIPLLNRSIAAQFLRNFGHYKKNRD